MSASKPLRQAMPETAALIDALRDAFGAETINDAIRNGMQGSTDFYASENGHQIGHKLPETDFKPISLADICLGSFVRKENTRG